MRRSLSFLLVSVVLTACSGGDDADAADGGPSTTTDGGGGGTDAGDALPARIGPSERPARVVWPSDWDRTTPIPLVVLLHGYGATAAIQDIYWRLSAHSRAHGYALLLPDGTLDSSGSQFWNATPACCDRDGTGIDDEGYLRDLVHEMKDRFAIDPARVYFTGHSNGGFMSYRMACAMSDEIAAIASLAGATYLDEPACGATEPVSVLEVHGDADDLVAYDGTAFYPSAPVGVERWATRAGCDTTMPTTLEPLDLEMTIAGAETTVTRYETGCAPGVDAELWTIAGGSHIPTFNDTWAETLVGWLFQHSK